MAAPVRAVLFDLGGTLIESLRAEDCIAHWQGRGRHLDAPAVRAALYRADHIFMAQFPDLWRVAGPDFRDRYWRTVHAELGLPAPGPGVTAAWGTRWRRFADVLPALRRLRLAGVPAALVSNWSRGGRATLEDAGLAGRFAAVVFSGEAGLEKPDPRIFLRAARTLGVPPRQCLHLGDNVRDDVGGAAGAGMQAVLLHRHPEWCAAPAPPPGVPLVPGLEALDLLLPQSAAGRPPVAATAARPRPAAAAGI